jgi:hypothetical protein
VHGIARGWKQAVSLRGAGLTQKDVAATSVFLDRVSKGRITLDKHSTVVVEELSQIGRGDMLQLLKLQQEHGFRRERVRIPSISILPIPGEPTRDWTDPRLRCGPGGATGPLFVERVLAI